MNLVQKLAWLGVGCAIVCVVLYLGLLPFFGPRASAAVFALFAVSGLEGLVGRKDKLDERDVAILRKATLVGFTMSYLGFVFACMGSWAVIYMWQGKESVSIHVLPIITMAGFFIAYVVRCITILLLYGRPMEADHA